MSTAAESLPPPPTQHGPGQRRRSLRWLRVTVIGAVIVIIGVAAVFGSRLSQDANLVKTPLIGRAAPTRALPLLEGNGTLDLGSLRGRIVVVNFWASWCVPCREEHGALTAASAAYRKAGVTFVGVTYQDRKKSAVAFLDELGRGKGYRYVSDPQSRLAIDFGVFGVPETFFVDRTGTIVAKITGASTLPMLSRVLNDIIAGRTPDASIRTGPNQPAPSP